MHCAKSSLFFICNPSMIHGFSGTTAPGMYFVVGWSTLNLLCNSFRRRNGIVVFATEDPDAVFRSHTREGESRIVVKSNDAYLSSWITSNIVDSINEMA